MYKIIYNFYKFVLKYKPVIYFTGSGSFKISKFVIFKTIVQTYNFTIIASKFLPLQISNCTNEVRILLP